MELSELEKNWQVFSERLEENTRVNKKILNEMMTRKPKRRIHLLRTKSAINMILSAVFGIIYLSITTAPLFSFSGLMSVFVVLIGGVAHYFDTYQRYKLLGEIDFAKSIKDNKQIFVRYEEKKLIGKKVSMWFLLTLIPIGTYVSLKIGREVLDLGMQVFLPIVIATVVVLGFSMFRQRLLKVQLQKLKDEIDELGD